MYFFRHRGKTKVDDGFKETKCIKFSCAPSCRTQKGGVRKNFLFFDMI